MKVTHQILISLFCLVFSSAYANSDLRTETPQILVDTDHLQNCSEDISTQEGVVRGFIKEKDNLKSCTYLGIPYAKAPVGDLRWTAPQKPEPRTELLNATSYGPDCMQNRWLSDATLKSAATETSEDCLYLNIWKPTKPGKYPVMFWIHGGGLFIGSAAWPIYDATILAARNDVVVVTINYRLGAFGYLSHPSLIQQDDVFNGGSNGNYGLLDQIQALRWVKDNIENFNGDPNNVTIFGESAGGWSVFNLLTTPASEDLFHKAIAQSGGSKTSHTTEDAFKIGERFAGSLDCEKDKNVAQCLRNISAKEITKKALGANGRCMVTGGMGKNFCFIPREDGTLLPASSFDSITAGKYKKIPIIAGYTSMDIPFLKESTIESLNLMEEHSVWMYKFKYKKNSLNILSSGIHGIDLPFVFNTLEDFKVFHNKISMYKENHSIKAQAFINDMQSYWTNFAKTGNPNTHYSTHDTTSDTTSHTTQIEVKNTSLLHWPEYQGRNYLYLSNETVVKNK